MTTEALNVKDRQIDLGTVQTNVYIGEQIDRQGKYPLYVDAFN